MNPERATDAAIEAVKRYVRARESKKQDKSGEWSTGMTILNDRDQRIPEMARLIVEAIIAVDDGRARISVEAKAIQMGDVFTRYSVKDGVAVDEEVTALSAKTSLGKTVLKYRRPNDATGEVTIDATYLLSVYRPTLDDLREQIANL